VSLFDYFTDISLNVLGCSDLKASFKKYCEVELLEKDNAYNAGKFGLQPAKKGILFNSFPPVLLLHLKRFDFDMVKQQHRKINDRHVFPPVLQLNEFLSPEADRSIDYTYHLHGYVLYLATKLIQQKPFDHFSINRVLVHSGGVHGGHYYAFLKPTTGPQWFKFDDSVVHKVSSQRAIDDNFGGIETTYWSSTASNKISNACTRLFLVPNFYPIFEFQKKKNNNFLNYTIQFNNSLFQICFCTCWIANEHRYSNQWNQRIFQPI